MNNPCNSGAMFIHKTSNNINDDSLDDELSLLETTLTDGIKEEDAICNKSNSDIISPPPEPNGEYFLEKSSPGSIQPYTSDINLTMQLVCPKNTSVLSSTQHMQLSNKTMLCQDYNLSFPSKSDIDSNTLTNNSTLVTSKEVSPDLKSLESVQNNDCDIIISQCDSSLEQNKQCSANVAFKSLNSEVQLNYDHRDVLENNDDEVNVCKFSEFKSVINNTVNNLGSKSFPEGTSSAQVMTEIPEMTMKKMLLSDEKLNMEYDTAKVLTNKTHIVNDKVLDKITNSVSKSYFNNESKFDNEPQLVESTECKLANDPDKDVIEVNEDTGIEESNDGNCVNKCISIDTPMNKSTIFCSTPKHLKTNGESVKGGTSINFGQVSPLCTSDLKSKLNRKRKNDNLSIIEEVDENYEEKKLKRVDEEELLNINSFDPKMKEDKISSLNNLSCFEPAAKSILKMWQPNRLSHKSGASQYVVLDEIESESEDTDNRKEGGKEQPADDFELACESLTEVLMKSSSHIESLQKYHSHIQLESQRDDEKFDGLLQELSQLLELDDKTCLSLKSIDLSTLTDGEKTITNASSVDKCVSITKTDSNKNNTLDSDSDGNETVIEIKPDVKAETSTAGISNVNLKIKVLDDPSWEHAGSDNSSMKNDESDKQNNKKELTIVYANKKDLAMDEEDFLLEEAADANKKPYEFFEYVSSDPKENEDNYNPEWQKLGKLTTDEERYKAVRDRWRSLVPPNPNKDLSLRQWRKRNNLPPLDTGYYKKNNAKDSQVKNQFCTAVFELKMDNIMKELEDRRMSTICKRNRDFEVLAMNQEEELMRLVRSGYDPNCLIFKQLQARHIMECSELRNYHNQDIRRIEQEAEDRVVSLKAASDEVKVFQKFYQGVGESGDHVSLYMTDLEVQELLETEDMLEQYKKFYK